MDDLESVINEELDKVNPSIKDIYNSLDNISLQEMVGKLNKSVDRVHYKRNLIGILNRFSELGYDISYNKDMSIKELENIINNINM